MSARPTMPFPRQPLPHFARVRQNLQRRRIDDPRAEVRGQLLERGLRARLAPGARVAITAGSRGMAGFVALLQGMVDAVKEAGGIPFLVPAMGSHGGATEEGQIEILRRLGVTERIVGAPIHATMDTVALGAAPNGAEAHCDKLAFEADGILVLGRVTLHPESSTAGLASGLLKMVTIGLGKQRGAQSAHSHGLWDSVREIPRRHLEKAPIVFGVALVENGRHEPLHVEVVDPRFEAFLEADTRLLVTAREHFARLPFDDLDLLVVDAIGKDICGSGLDPNVIGTARLGTGEDEGPTIRRLAALSLTPASLGNGIGIGMADFTTERFMRSYDPHVTWVNVLTAAESQSNVREASVPLALPSDQEAMEVALRAALAGEQPRICRIHSTLMLEDLYVSEGLLDEVKRSDSLEVVEPLQPMRFDDVGNLRDLVIEAGHGRH